MKGLEQIKKYIEEELSLLENQPKPQTELQIGHEDGRTIALYNVLELVNHKIDREESVLLIMDKSTGEIKPLLREEVLIEKEHELGEEETEEEREVRERYENHKQDLAKENNLN